MHIFATRGCFNKAYTGVMFRQDGTSEDTGIEASWSGSVKSSLVLINKRVATLYSGKEIEDIHNECDFVLQDSPTSFLVASGRVLLTFTFQLKSLDGRILFSYIKSLNIVEEEGDRIIHVTSNRHCGGAHTACLDNQGNIYLTSLRSNTTTRIARFTKQKVKQITFITKKKHQLMVVIGRDLHLMDITNETIVTSFKSLHEQNISSFVCSPTNEMLGASVSYDEKLKIIDIQLGKVIEAIPVGDPISCCRFSPDGKMVYLGTLRGVLKRFDLEKNILMQIGFTTLAGGLSSIQLVNDDFFLPEIVTTDVESADLCAPDELSDLSLISAGRTPLKEIQKPRIPSTQEQIKEHPLIQEKKKKRISQMNWGPVCESSPIPRSGNAVIPRNNADSISFSATSSSPSLLNKLVEQNTEILKTMEDMSKRLKRVEDHCSNEDSPKNNKLSKLDDEMYYSLDLHLDRIESNQCKNRISCIKMKSEINSAIECQVQTLSKQLSDIRELVSRNNASNGIWGGPSLH